MTVWLHWGWAELGQQGFRRTGSGSRLNNIEIGLYRAFASRGGVHIK